jgi:hypothetical protein
MIRANEDNSVYVCGAVASSPELNHQLYGEYFYSLKLAVPRLSGAVDMIPVMFPGRISDIPKEGEYLRVFGQLRSYNRHVDGINRLMITVFAKQAEPAEPEAGNEVTLCGHICKPVIFRTTPFMREIGDLLIAVNRSYNKSDYLPCIVWGRNARYAHENLSVGSCVRITGRLQSREYQKVLEDGAAEIRTAYEVSCSSLELML